MSRNTTAVKVAIIGDDRQLAKSLKSAENRLQKLKKKLKSANSGVRGLFAGASAAALVASLGAATKAAAQDAKEQAVLANTLRNVTGATKDQIAAVEESITKLSIQAGIADSELRPAFSKLVGVLKDTDVTMTALNLATDVAAGTGKDLQAVSAAMSKAFAGNTTALSRLVPGLDKSKDLVAQLAERFSGAAQAAADADPFTRLNVIMGELQEQLGTYLLPYLQQFVAFLTSDEGQIYMANLVESIGAFVVGLSNAITYLSANFEWIKNIALLWAAVTVGIKAAQAAMLLYTAATGVATGATATLGNVMKKSGWLAIALILTSLIGDAMTQDIDYGNLNLPNAPLQAAPFVDPGSDPLAKLQAMLAGLKTVDTKPLAKIGDAAQAMADKMKKAAESIVKSGQEFRNAVDLSFGLNESGSRFSATKVIRQMEKVLKFARELPAKLKALAKGGATPETLQQILALGPQQGYAVATGLLESGQLGRYNTLTRELGRAGLKAGAQAMTGSYTININKANMTATEIVNAIKAYERTTGRKLLLNG